MTNFPKNTEQEKSVIFLHIPKTAGSTLNRIIARQYEQKSIFSIYGLRRNERECESIDEFKRLPEARRREIKVLQGHIGFGLHEYLPQPSTYITILRDPVDRIISHYYFVLRDPDHYLYNEVTSKHMSLKDYVCSGISPELDNGQTKLLSTTTAVNSYTQGSNEMLESAKKNIKEHFALVGLTERFDETLILLKRSLNWTPPFYTKQKVTKNRPIKEDVSKDILKLIEKSNELDIELYKYVENLLKEQINQSANFLETELKQFQFLNGFYSKLDGFYRVVNKVKSLRAKS